MIRRLGRHLVAWAALACVAALSSDSRARSGDEAAAPESCENKVVAHWRRFSLGPRGDRGAVRPTEAHVGPGLVTGLGATPDGHKPATRLDGRELRRHQQHLGLLRREIDELGALLAATPSWSPDHARILRRLADRYAELERDLAEAGERRDLQAHARGWAIVLYRTLADEHPDHCRYPLRAGGDRGCVDQVLFALGQAYERSGEPGLAAPHYRRLCEEYPTSAYVPRAYLARGEQAFEDARAGGVPWATAVDLYERAAARLERDEVGAYARYKLAHAEWAAGDGEAAIGDMVAAVRIAQRHGGAHAAELAERARADLVFLYAELGDAGKALATFESVSSQRGAALELLERLGRRLYDVGRFEQAIAVLEELKQKNSRGSACGYQAAITRAVVAASAANKEPVERALDAQLAAFRASAAAGPPERAAECAMLTVPVLLDVATAWHIEAAGSNGFPGTGEPRTFDAAGRTYQRLLDGFTRAQIDAYGSSDTEPGYARVMRATGDLAYAERRWLDCARNFGAAEQANQGGERAGDELLFAAVCWQRALDERLEKRETERNLGRALFDAATDTALAAAFDRYACRAQAAADDLEAAAAHTTVLHARDKLRKLTGGARVARR